MSGHFCGSASEENGYSQLKRCSSFELILQGQAVHPICPPTGRPMTALIQLAQFHHSRIEATAILRFQSWRAIFAISSSVKWQMKMISFERFWGVSKTANIFQVKNWENSIEPHQAPKKVWHGTFLFSVVIVGFIFISRSCLFSNTGWTFAWCVGLLNICDPCGNFVLCCCSLKTRVTTEKWCLKS